MDINLCVKYLDFLDIQTNRFIEDGVIEEEELESMYIELIKFKETVKKSKLPKEIKVNIQKIDFEFSPLKLKLSNTLTILLIISIGGWGILLYNYFQQKKRSNNILHLKNQARAISNDLKLNYNYSI